MGISGLRKGMKVSVEVSVGRLNHWLNLNGMAPYIIKMTKTTMPVMRVPSVWPELQG